MATLDLRPLSLGELLDRTFFLYRRNFLLFVGIAAIPYSLFFIVKLAGAVMPVLSRAVAAGRTPSAGVAIAGFGGGIFAVVAVIVGLIAYVFSIGATVFAVSEIYMGRQTSIRASLRRVRGHAGTIFGVMLLSGLIVLAGFIALIIPGVYLMLRIPVATAAALLEDLGPADSIRRSFELTKGFAGRASLIFLLSGVLAWVTVAVFQFPFAILIVVSAKQAQLVLLWTILAQLGNFLGSSLVAPVSTISFALFYYDLRVRKEAFDLQMMMKAIGGEPVPPPITGGVPSMFGRDVS